MGISESFFRHKHSKALVFLGNMLWGQGSSHYAIVLIFYVSKLWRLKVAAAVIGGKEFQTLQGDKSEMIAYR